MTAWTAGTEEAPGPLAGVRVLDFSALLLGSPATLPRPGWL
jgi:hypothetical protein